MHLRHLPFLMLLAMAFISSSVSAQTQKEAADPADFATEAALKSSLARDCYVLKEGKLCKVSADAFAKTRVFVVYYSHIYCGVCVPVTEKLNNWKVPAGVSVLLGYRDDADNAALAAYLKKSGIHFPAIDTKYIRIRRTHQGVMHPFYSDADEGAPRFRFFRADGSEIDPTTHGAASKFGAEVMDQMDALLLKMLSSNVSS